MLHFLSFINAHSSNSFLRHGLQFQRYSNKGDIEGEVWNGRAGVDGAKSPAALVLARRNKHVLCLHVRVAEFVAFAHRLVLRTVP